jgi:hypothetical protein
MKITGHSTHEMFERYNTVDDQDIRNAVDQLGKFLENVDQNVDQTTKKKVNEKSGQSGKPRKSLK